MAHHSVLRNEKRLRVLFCLIGCALFFTAAPPPAQFKSWVMAKLPDTPEGLGIDSKGNIYTTLFHTGEVVILKDDGSYDHIAWVPSRRRFGRFRRMARKLTCGRHTLWLIGPPNHIRDFLWASMISCSIRNRRTSMPLPTATPWYFACFGINIRSPPAHVPLSQTATCPLCSKTQKAGR
jgi:hypothetical protein